MSDNRQQAGSPAAVRGVGATSAAWLPALRWYLGVIALGSLAWEFAHLPLYTIWKTGRGGEITFAAVHCTGGDILIGTASLVLALVLGGGGWPNAPPAYLRVAALTVGFGLAYTIFSEWLNIVVRKSWAYSELMPVVPGTTVGLSPLLQWVLLPAAAFWLARRRLHVGRRQAGFGP
jgi:hypothetical protein